MPSYRCTECMFANCADAGCPWSDAARVREGEEEDGGPFGEDEEEDEREQEKESATI